MSLSHHNTASIINTFPCCLYSVQKKFTDISRTAYYEDNIKQMQDLSQKIGYRHVFV